MRKAAIYRNHLLAGFLIEDNTKHYTFTYDASYYKDDAQPAVSLTLPKSQPTYHSHYLFPFFYNMLSEGVNRQLQCRQLKIEERDHFGLLLATAQFDTIGFISIKPVIINEVS